MKEIHSDSSLLLGGEADVIISEFKNWKVSLHPPTYSHNKNLNGGYQVSRKVEQGQIYEQVYDTLSKGSWYDTSSKKKYHFK